MKISNCSFLSRLSRDKIGELCCLYAIGELAPEDALRMKEHLRECESCRVLVEEFEKITLFDLPSIEVLRSEGVVPEGLESINAGELLENVRESARSNTQRSREEDEWKEVACPAPVAMQPMRVFRLAGLAALAAGWLVAVVLILPQGKTLLETYSAGGAAEQHHGSAEQSLESQAVALSGKLQAANASVGALQSKLSKMSERSVQARSELTHLKAQYQDLNGNYTSLQARLTQQESLVEQQSAQLQLTRDSLNTQISAKDALEGQLSDVYSRLDKQRQEVAKLQRIAATVPVAYPVSESRVSEGEAREILGARDLHIVDVYDLDDSGKATHTYGRIYYVNHSLLIFYAFDLSKLETNHKLVAFQAWGFRQPKSSKVESLGLFYLDNATLNRWALRISNPEILSRIDTLFVTVEPPGGSRFPKGRRLLMASLAGPANHP